MIMEQTDDSITDVNQRQLFSGNVSINVTWICVYTSIMDEISEIHASDAAP